MAGNGGGNWRDHLQPCEYLQSDGNSWIVLDKKIDVYNDFALKGIYLSASGDFFFGSRNGYLDHSFIAFRWSNKTGGFTCQKSENNEIYFNASDHSYIFKIQGNTMSINNFDDTLVSSKSISGHQFTSSYNFALFTCNSSGGVLTPCKIGCKIYYCYNINNFDLLSCYVIDEYTDNKGNACSSGVAGMVDTLTGIFYTNDGSGNFTHGADIIL